ncbi:MAG: uncharacterized protein A8A55_1967 [Amphiamblys sp. WSBS2006]|nr:MAG: uncharacterized protein A8A55_1967 [Amphiamblys sp. WSBS2006]
MQGRIGVGKKRKRQGGCIKQLGGEDLASQVSRLVHTKEESSSPGKHLVFLVNTVCDCRIEGEIVSATCARIVDLFKGIVRKRGVSLGRLERGAVKKFLSMNHRNGALEYVEAICVFLVDCVVEKTAGGSTADDLVCFFESLSSSPAPPEETGVCGAVRRLSCAWKEGTLSAGDMDRVMRAFLKVHGVFSVCSDEVVAYLWLQKEEPRGVSFSGDDLLRLSSGCTGLKGELFCLYVRHVWKSGVENMKQQTFLEMERLLEQHACFSERSVCDVCDGSAYWLMADCFIRDVHNVSFGNMFEVVHSLGVKRAA